MEGRLYDDVGIVLALMDQHCRGAEGVKLSSYDVREYFDTTILLDSRALVSPISYFMRQNSVQACILSTILSKYLEYVLSPFIKNKDSNNNKKHLWLT